MYKKDIRKFLMGCLFDPKKEILWNAIVRATSVDAHRAIAIHSLCEISPERDAAENLKSIQVAVKHIVCFWLKQSG